MTKGLWLALAGTAVLGCTPPQRRVLYTEHHDSNKVITSFSTPADLRLAFLRPPGVAGVYCAEPVPDVALGSEMSGSGSLAASAALNQAASSNTALSQENSALRSELAKAIESYERETKKTYSSSISRSGSTSVESSSSSNLNLAATAKLAVTVAELGGRSQQVLLAREFLYRICEARANGFFEGGQAYVDLQTNALRLIEAIASSQRQSSDTEKLTANAEVLKQVNAYNDQQKKLCDEKQKACEAAAATEADKKKDCPPLHKKCVDAIKLLEPPSTGTGSPKSSPSILLKPETPDAPPPANNDKNGGSMIPTVKPTK